MWEDGRVVAGGSLRVAGVVKSKMRKIFVNVNPPRKRTTNPAGRGEPDGRGKSEGANVDLNEILNVR